MKIALVSFGHTDVVLPLYKKLKQNKGDVDLIFCFALNRKSESVINFEEKEIATGYLPVEKVNEILSNQIYNYLEDISTVHFFIYYNLKLRSLRNLFLSIKLVQKLEKYDIIHFNGTNAVLPQLIFLLRKKNLVFTIHDIKSHSGEKTKYNFAEKINTYIIKSKYPLIVQNLSDLRYLKTEYPRVAGKLHYIPFGVLEIYRQFKRKENKIPRSSILLFGRISPYKGIDYLLMALEELAAKGIHLNTVIAGQGKIDFNVEIYKKLDIALINRNLSNEELVGLIQSTKIVICPYTDATQSGVVMTAFAFYKPVIASNVGGFKDIITTGYNGVLIPPRDSKALALAIENLIRDDATLDLMSRNIAEFENVNPDFCWERIAYKLDQLYKSIV